MVNALKLGPGLTLPIEAITETIAILGIRNSGKTNTAAVYAEELLAAGQQVVIIDPTDAWWGLKSSADGQKAGYPVVVLGGRHADLPLASTDGKLIADFVVEQGASVICSLRGFESKQQEMRFTTDFLRRLYYLKGQQDAPTPLSLIIDEASRLVPQRVMGEDAACVGAVQQIVRQGRSSGFGIGLIDQRAATVNKDVLAQLEMLVVHRTTGPQDRKALQEWIVAHDTAGREKEFLGSLASLAQGEAWFWSPGWLDLFKKVQVRKRRTFDSSRTPRAGEVVVTPKKIAEVDLDALRTKLAATLEKAKADDPKELRRQIAELRNRATATPEGWVSHETMVSQINAAVNGARREEQARYEGLIAGARQGFANILTPLGVIHEQVRRAIDDVQMTQAMLDRAPDDSVPALPRMVHLPMRREQGRVTRAAVMELPDRGKIDYRGEPLAPSEQRILNALALMERLRMPMEKTNLGFLAGYSEGGRFNNLLGGLRTKGLVTRTGYELTPEGSALANADEANVRTLAELHALWLSKLPPSEGKVLKVLLDQYPGLLTKDQLGAYTDYSEGGRFNNILGRLSSLGALVREKGGISAGHVLFPKGFR